MLTSARSLLLATALASATLITSATNTVVYADATEIDNETSTETGNDTGDSANEFDAGQMAVMQRLADLPDPVFDVQAGYGQVFVTNGVPGRPMGLHRWIAAGDAIGVERVEIRVADEQGSQVFRDLEPGWYLLGHARGINWAFEVLDPEQPAPAQSFYDSQQLVDGFQYIETRDGTLLSAYVVLPGPIEDGPYPTVVEYSGYDPSNPTGGVPAQPSSLIASTFGYAVVGVNVRGTGCSGGAYDFFERMQELDGYDVIETVAAQPWVKHGHVGMVGISYPGISQLFVAKTQPPGLAAIAPQSVYGDTATGILAPGGLLNTGFATSWVNNVLSNSQPNGTSWVRSVIADGDEACASNQLLRLQNVNAEDKARANPFYTDEIAAPLDTRRWVGDIDVPVFLASAFQDEQTGPSFGDLIGKFDSSPSVRTMVYNGLHGDPTAPQIMSEWAAFLSLYVDREIPSVPVAAPLVAGVVSESVFGGPLTYPANRFADVASYEEAWARWESEPEISILFENGGAPGELSGLPIASWEETSNEWPLADTAPLRQFFTADGQLVDAPVDPAGTAVQFHPDPAVSTTSFLESGSEWDRNQRWNWQAQGEGDNLRFQTAPLDSDIVMAGTASADLWLRSDATDAELEVVISEIRPDGQEMLVQAGQLQASYGGLDASSTELLPVHTGREEDFAPLVPGEWREVRMQVPVFAHAFRAGSSIRIEINTPGGDTARWEFELDGPGAEATHQIGTGADFPSSINLPVIAGWSARTPLPTCTLRGQPCRDAAPIANERAPVEVALPAGYADYTSELYTGDANWMCAGGSTTDVCSRDLDTTAVFADGTTEVRPFERDLDSDVDCFYVYPTISTDESSNSDLTPQESQEIRTVLNQAAQFGATCRVFAPVYRQVTLNALFGSVPRDPDAGEIAYSDVLDAFKEFIVNRSDGRDFVVIGHSQGAGLLSRLIAEEIDDEPLLRDRMLSALLLGTSVNPTRFENVAPCTSVDDRSCLVSYSTYRNTDPPEATVPVGLFGRTADGPAVCVNPAAIGGGNARSMPIFASPNAFDDPADDATVGTPWVTFPDMLTIECVETATHGYLQVTIDQVDGPRRDDIAGDFLPGWGLHISDMSVAMTDLVEFVAAQRIAANPSNL